MVPRVGIEPTLPKEQDFKSCVSTNSTIQARNNKPDYFRQFVSLIQEELIFSLYFLVFILRDSKIFKN